MFCGGAPGAKERCMYQWVLVYSTQIMYLCKHSHLRASRVVLIMYVAGPLPRLFLAEIEQL